MKFQGDMLNFCDFIQVFVFTRNHHLKYCLIQCWFTSIFYFKLSYDVPVIQWITSRHKNRMTTCVITLWRVYVTPLTTFVSTMSFLTEIIFILKVIKSHFKGSCDKQSLTLVVILYESYETRRTLVSQIHK